MKILQGKLDAAKARFAVVASRFNGRVVDDLVGGAVDCLTRHGCPDDAIDVVRVPGAWEIPLAARELAAAGSYDAIVALGVVVRGETSHYDVICREASAGLAAVSIEHGIAIGFGVLTCETSEQAVERAGGKAGNKGWDAALAAIEMVDLCAQIRGSNEVA